VPSAPKLELVDGQLRYSAVVPRRSQRSAQLGPFSPVFAYEGDPPRTELVKSTLTVGSLTRTGETWSVVASADLKRFFHAPQTVLTVNGLPGTLTTPLGQGDVLEHEGACWVVQFPRQKQLDTALGPLWRAFRTGALTLTAGSKKRGWSAVLRGGTFDLALDSLQRLRALLMCDFAQQLESLTLHCAASDPSVDWPTFVAAHLELAKTAPFAVGLFTPHPAAGATLLPSLSSVAAFGSGSRWDNEQPDARLNGAQLSAKGWVTLTPDDWVDVNGSTVRFHPTQRVPAEPARTAPWVLLPARRWSQVKLDALHGDWSAHVDGVTRWVTTKAGVHQRLADETLGPLVPWFTVTQSASGTAFFFMPGPSPFLAGERTLPANVALTHENVTIFIDELLQQGDCAGEGLAAIAAQAPDAQMWHARLLAPYGAQQTFAVAHIDPSEGAHCGGFFRILRVRPWLDFTKDLPVLLSHPLLCRLERLELVYASSPTSTQQVTLAKAVHEHRPGLQVSFGQPG
jgi:hypothetical protein